MSDRVTQLQQTLNGMAGQFCDSIGVIHSEHEKYARGESEKVVQQISQYVEQFSECLAVSNANLDILLESLPSISASQELQAQTLSNLEKENANTAESLQQAVDKAETKLRAVQDALAQISNAHYSIQKKENYLHNAMDTT